MALPLSSIRSYFPIFKHRPELVYLDNAATSQKPQSVIQSMTDFYEKENANIHRGLYELSDTATKRYEAVRGKVAAFIGATDPKSIAFTKGATESINSVAQGFLKRRLQKGDNVVITVMEHHANLIPWQQVCHQQEATLRVIPVSADGELIMEKVKSLLDGRTKLLALTHISNVLGTINPIEEIISLAHQKDIPVLVDGAQSVGHYPIDVTKSDIDFFVFSAHKMFGPLGTGVLYCKKEWTTEIQSFQFGGGSIRSVAFDHTEFLEYPFCMEAGTANIAGVIGLGAAIDFIQQLDLVEMVAHEKNLSSTLKEKLKSLGGVTIMGNPKNASDIVSFQVDGIHPHDVAGFLANENIAVRAGHHCAQPLLDTMGIPATVRASFAAYNTLDEVDRTISALKSLKKFWS